MEIPVTYKQGCVPVTVFQARGELSAATVQQLQEEVQRAYAGGTRSLLLDLSEVSFISSAGLRGIHRTFAFLRSDAPEESDEAVRRGLRAGTFRSSHLKLLNPSPSALETLRTAGFDLFLEIHSNLKEAVASF